MKKILISLALASLAVACLPAMAQTSHQPAVSTNALFLALGQTPGLTALADDFVIRLKQDARLGPHFKNVNQKNLSKQLTDQFCALSGGPCVYEGADMKSAHMDMDITKGDFNALVEVLQAAMDAKGIAFTTQNQLLALLAPMHRAVITVR
jgi:hemoglobin